jgi:hypothetical protein
MDLRNIPLKLRAVIPAWIRDLLARPNLAMTYDHVATLVHLDAAGHRLTSPDIAHDDARAAPCRDAAW